jgi:predicted TPR repeat methyltransferase
MTSGASGNATGDQQAIEAIKARIAAGDLAAARSACEAFLSRVSDSTRQSPVRAWLGVVEQRSGALTSAVEQYELALQSDPQNARLTVQLGLVNFQLKNMDRAAQLYRAAIALDPAFPLAHYNLGLVQFENRDWSGARRSFESALAQEPSFPEALTNLANTLVKLNEPDLAAGCYQQAINLNPRLATAYSGLALLYLRRQQRAPAMRCLEAAVANDPTLLDAWLDLADCHHREGDDTKALACVAEVLKQAPDNETALFEQALYSGGQPASPPAVVVERIFDGMAEIFDEHLTARLGYRIPELLIAELEPWLKAFPDQHGRKPDVLDLGCGTGLFGVVARPYAAKLVGVDLSKGMLEQARTRGIYDLLAEGDIQAWLAARPDGADLIAATDVLVYLGRLEGTFAEVSRHLPPGGLFAFSTEAAVDDSDDVLLQAAGRYAHGKAYVDRLANTYGMPVIQRLDTVIRTERAKPVHGHLYVLRKA